MDSKNVIFAIVLSTIVLIFWATFFEPPIIEEKVTKNETMQNESVEAPSVEITEKSKKISRNEAINAVDRISLENNNIKGSISLEGGIIDDVIFKNYNKELNNNEKVVFLNPKNSNDDTRLVDLQQFSVLFEIGLYGVKR